MIDVDGGAAAHPTWQREGVGVGAGRASTVKGCPTVGGVYQCYRKELERWQAQTRWFERPEPIRL